MDENYITEKEVAEYFNISTHTLKKDRVLKTGMPYYKIRGKVRYKKEDIQTYLESCKILPKK